MPESSQATRLCARVYGRVQGVGFRQFVVQHATALGLVGYVRNEDRDGSVEVVAEGTAGALATLLRELQRGPLLSRVERVEVAWKAATGAFTDFQIVR